MEFSPRGENLQLLTFGKIWWEKKMATCFWLIFTLILWLCVCVGGACFVADQLLCFFVMRAVHFRVLLCSYVRVVYFWLFSLWLYVRAIISLPFDMAVPHFCFDTVFVCERC